MELSFFFYYKATVNILICSVWVTPWKNCHAVLSCHVHARNRFVSLELTDLFCNFRPMERSQTWKETLSCYERRFMTRNIHLRWPWQDWKRELDASIWSYVMTPLWLGKLACMPYRFFLFFSISHRLSMVELRPSSSLSTGCVVSYRLNESKSWRLFPNALVSLDRVVN